MWLFLFLCLFVFILDKIVKLVTNNYEKHIENLKRLHQLELEEQKNQYLFELETIKNSLWLNERKLLWRSKHLLRRKIDDLSNMITIIGNSNFKNQPEFLNLRERLTMWLEDFNLFTSDNILNLPPYKKDLFWNVCQRGQLLIRNFKTYVLAQSELIEILKSEPIFYSFENN